MKNGGTKLLVTVTIVAALLIFFNVVVLKRVRMAYAPASGERASLFNIAGQVHEFFGYVAMWHDLAQKNKDLTSALQQNLVDKAALESLKTENESLRKALGLSSTMNREIIAAGIFNLDLAPDGYSALINKGSKDGVVAGDVVVSPDGVLVGRIAAVSDGSSHITLSADPSFKITVSVLGGSVSGIAHGALSDGMTLDLIVQADDIKEGDVLVSTGDDMSPAGLVVGTVSNVQASDTQLFKKVKVRPAFDPKNGRVLVVKQ